MSIISSLTARCGYRVGLLAWVCLATACSEIGSRQPPPVLESAKNAVTRDREYAMAVSGALPVYTYIRDKTNFSACTGDCLRLFPRVLWTKEIKPTQPFGELSVGNERQLTYAGRPLYIYSGDVPDGPPRGHLAFAGWIPFMGTQR